MLKNCCSFFLRYSYPALSKCSPITALLSGAHCAIQIQIKFIKRGPRSAFQSSYDTADATLRSKVRLGPAAGSTCIVKYMEAFPAEFGLAAAAVPVAAVQRVATLAR